MSSTREVLGSRALLWGGLVGALMLGLGLLGAGFLVGRGFERGRAPSATSRSKAWPKPS